MDSHAIGAAVVPWRGSRSLKHLQRRRPRLRMLPPLFPRALRQILDQMDKLLGNEGPARASILRLNPGRWVYHRSVFHWRFAAFGNLDDELVYGAGRRLRPGAAVVSQSRGEFQDAAYGPRAHRQHL
jgi:hypothetical protein